MEKGITKRKAETIVIKWSIDSGIIKQYIIDNPETVEDRVYKHNKLQRIRMRHDVFKFCESFGCPDIFDKMGKQFCDVTSMTQDISEDGRICTINIQFTEEFKEAFKESTKPLEPGLNPNSNGWASFCRRLRTFDKDHSGPAYRKMDLPKERTKSPQVMQDFWMCGKLSSVSFSPFRYSKEELEEYLETLGNPFNPGQIYLYSYGGFIVGKGKIRKYTIWDLVKKLKFGVKVFDDSNKLVTYFDDIPDCYKDKSTKAEYVLIPKGKKCRGKSGGLDYTELKLSNCPVLLNKELFEPLVYWDMTIAFEMDKYDKVSPKQFMSVISRIASDYTEARKYHYRIRSSTKTLMERHLNRKNSAEEKLSRFFRLNFDETEAYNIQEVLDSLSREPQVKFLNISMSETLPYDTIDVEFYLLTLSESFDTQKERYIRLKRIFDAYTKYLIATHPKYRKSKIPLSNFQYTVSFRRERILVYRLELRDDFIDDSYISHGESDSIDDIN